jgi:hypothetical protein
VGFRRTATSIAFRGIGAAAGVVGPAVFTAAWIVSSLRQAGHAPADIQISGLAAPDAKDPWIMITGFLVLGGCAAAFGEAARQEFSARSPGRGQRRAARAEFGPVLIEGAGMLTIAAGLLRRDHMLLVPGHVSWHNHAHDAVSAAIYVDLVLAQLALARRFGRDAAWKAWRPWLQCSAAATALILIVFAAGTSAPDAGIAQRAAVTVPLAVMAAIAARLLRQRSLIHHVL